MTDQNLKNLQTKFFDKVYSEKGLVCTWRTGRYSPHAIEFFIANVTILINKQTYADCRLASKAQKSNDLYGRFFHSVY